MIVTAVISLTLWAGLAAAACLAMHRARQAAAPTPPPPDDPDSTADDFDDVARMTELPPVPLPAYWSEADDAMFAWFAEGAR